MSGNDPRPRDYFIATLAGIALGVSSLGAALALNVPALPVDQLTGAAWAWGVGGGTVHWVLPSVKQTFGVEEVLER